MRILPTSRFRHGWAALAGAFASALTLSVAPAAQADFGLVPGSFKADAFQADGSLETQAGAHPHTAVSEFAFKDKSSPGGVAPDGNVKTIDVDLPPGFAGFPGATAKCDRDNFNLLSTGLTRCPAASQIGIAEMTLNLFGGNMALKSPVFNLEPRDGEVADFGIPVLQATIHAVPRVRSNGDFGLSVRVSNVSQGTGLIAQKLILWGVPADASHDGDRVCLDYYTTEVVSGGNCSTAPYSNNLPRRPFLSNPTSCVGPVTSIANVDSWQNPGVFDRVPYTTSVGVDGCASVPFDPTFSALPDTRSAGAPTGLTVDIAVPQDDNPDGLSSAHLRDTTVTLPEGMGINPAAAAGLEACSDAQLDRGSTDPANCPEASKIGTLQVESPALEEPLTGSAYLGTQLSGDPESGEMFRMFLYLRSEKRGLTIKLAGAIRADKRTGRLTTTFRDNPQLPVSDLRLTLKGGARAALATDGRVARR